MTGNEYTVESAACCGEGQAAENPCSCGVKTYLTKEEESILHEIRKVRLEADGLRKASDGETYPEADERTTALRNEWKTLRDKLDDATERKLIALGHRAPPR